MQPHSPVLHSGEKKKGIQNFNHKKKRKEGDHFGDAGVNAALGDKV
jgi:hypothetical protein